MIRTVAITSLNPAKISAVKSAFNCCFCDQQFEFIGLNVPSDVSDQPISDDETRQGALNRVTNAQKMHVGYDFYVGLEAGIENNMTFAWMVIESNQKRGESRSASMQLPVRVLAQLTPDNELGNIIDQEFGTSNIKQKGGAISLLTHQQLSRSSVYHQALILALVPFTNPDLY